MVDRFNRVDAPPGHMPWDDPSYASYQGGTFAGVQAALPYIRDPGAGAILPSPVLKNLQFEADSYHGYAPHDFLHAEPRFATNPAAADDELRSLVDAAHGQGLYVIFDIVLNHVGNVFAYDCDPADCLCQSTGGAEAAFKPEPVPVHWRDAGGKPVAATSLDAWPASARPMDALVWPSELQDDRFFRRQGGKPPDAGEPIGDFREFKQMRTDDAALQSLLIKCHQYVIARWDADGFRIDALHYLLGGLPRLFGNAIREFALGAGKTNFFTFGEVFDGRAKQHIARFFDGTTGEGGDLASIVQ